ncbi:MAG: hypothetical protein VX095_07165 [Pseudomonadota bacterium]|nr:hypothetical protein [Pseudomonadota bacterium]
MKIDYDCCNSDVWFVEDCLGVPSLRGGSKQAGESSLEFLMILTWGVIPMMAAVWLYEDVLREYIAFNQIFLSSPFF